MIKTFRDEEEKNNLRNMLARLHKEIIARTNRIQNDVAILNAAARKRKLFRRVYEGDVSSKEVEEEEPFQRRRRRSFFEEGGGGGGDIDIDIHQILIVTVVSILKLLLMLVCMLTLNDDNQLR
eukprot:626353_1